MSVDYIMSVQIRVLPEVAELQNIQTDIPCPENGCDAVLPSSSSLEMHLIKKHKKDSHYLDRHWDELELQFFCPVPGCKYYWTESRSINQLRWFKKMKFLKQHYMKVHGERKAVCECGRRFITQSALRNHLENECNRDFVCSACPAKYSTMSALITHARRKDHPIPTSGRNNKRTAVKKIASLSSVRPIAAKEDIAAAALGELSAWRPRFTDASIQCNMLQESQNVEPAGSESLEYLQETSLNNHTTPPPNSSPLLDSLHTLLDIETQTDWLDYDCSTTTHTQTCPDFFDELVEFADIETQYQVPFVDIIYSQSSHSRFVPLMWKLLLHFEDLGAFSAAVKLQAPHCTTLTAWNHSVANQSIETQTYL